MQDKEKQNDDIKTEETQEGSVNANPFFDKPEDRPEGEPAPSETPLQERLKAGSGQAAYEAAAKEESVPSAKKSKMFSFGKEKSTDKLDSKELEKTKEELARSREELDTLKNQYVRLAADFDNYRKRQAQERQDIAKRAGQEFVSGLLPVFDSFDRAYLSFKNLDDPEKLKESFDVLHRQMYENLAKLNVTKIKTAGEFFDPNYHEGVMREETTEYTDNQIMQELQCGYMVGDKVVRAAMVKVASNSSQEQPPSPPAQDDTRDENA